MITDVYESLLHDLGEALKLPNLHPDSKNTCLIKFKGDLLVQIELDRTQQFLIIGTDLDAIPASRYRDSLFLEALKANGMPYPRYGTFAFSKQTNHFVLFEMLNLKELTGQKISEFLVQFLEKARIWKEAIAKGDLPTATSFRANSFSQTNLFGLRP